MDNLIHLLQKYCFVLLIAEMLLLGNKDETAFICAETMLNWSIISNTVHKQAVYNSVM